ncbi:glycine cleavage system aminomethyltransferase GcvT [Jannaschia sp. CCS1]|uniref:glycine cleavage system aminomethyltransferase GcvT n=1 Tax=Jannaschia sp. (strain CCS1) TaxID=290400 RepID=UPI000053CC9A|nr:glycine cleavage system aminomethyltransferase GcvT [Jannaschia sp. CCS1]ABD56537.1 glycine cleavage system T protein [Jannaschia sp. CCS1]
MADGDLKTLALADLHKELGGKFVGFAGYSMPVQYPTGVMAEHLWTRENAGLFDVSHMGQVVLPADADLEALVPVDVLGLAEGRQRYGFFTNDTGGVLDDLMIARGPDGLFLVVNAGCKAADIAHLRAHMNGVEVIEDRALLALQGPKADAALAKLIPGAADMRFMDSTRMAWDGAELWISRSGYTSEDGFEISIPDKRAEAFARALLADDRVQPIGLGARDSLRLEAGLPLYGQDMTPSISPVEAGQAWAIGKVRRTGGDRAGGFPGAEVLLDQLANGAPRRRAGLLPEGRAPMRAGVEIFASPDTQTPIGVVTSGGFGPTLGAPMALALIAADTPKDIPLFGDVRGKRLPVAQTKLPFTPPGYKR